MPADPNDQITCSLHGGCNPSECFHLHYPATHVRWICDSGCDELRPYNASPKRCTHNALLYMPDYR